jgi:hypothetical protein
MRTSGGEVRAVVEAFRSLDRAFLRPIGAELESRSIVDISHESLMRRWVKLAEWTKHEAWSTKVYRRLSASAKNHAKGEEGPWRNPQLATAARWRKENQSTAAWAGDGAISRER